MGRWYSQTLQGVSNHQITIITAYRVCQTARSGLLTAYKQQQQYLMTQTNALHPNPKQAMIKDLWSYIQSLLGPTHDILLMWDACSTPQDQIYKHSWHYANLITYNHNAHQQFPSIPPPEDNMLISCPEQPSFRYPCANTESLTSTTVHRATTGPCLLILMNKRFSRAPPQILQPQASGYSDWTIQPNSKPTSS